MQWYHGGPSKCVGANVCVQIDTNKVGLYPDSVQIYQGKDVIGSKFSKILFQKEQ